MGKNDDEAIFRDLPPDAQIAMRFPTQYGDVVFIKSTDDPICTRISLGGNEREGYYCNYRGNRQDLRKILKLVLETLEFGDIPGEFS